MNTIARIVVQKITYAQNSEDILLWRALSQVQNGFYVDVGAAWPDEDSVTKLFYDNGWCGINVEPNPVLFEKLSTDRSRDICLPLAVSDEAGEAEMFFFGETGLSTLEKNNLFNGIRQGYQPVAATVRVVTLTSILEQYTKGREIHFMKVDVEGLEARVLRGGDWKQFRPWIVVVEASLPSSQIASYDDWEPMLLAKAYVFVWADGLNRFYVAKEHEELKSAFQYPPNIFDGFSTRKEVDCQEQYEVEAAKAVQMQKERDHWWTVADQAVRERETLKESVTELARIREINLKLEYEAAKANALHDGVSAAASVLSNRTTELARENSAQMGEIINLRERLAFSLAHVESLTSQIGALQGALQAERSSITSQLYPLRQELFQVRAQLEQSLMQQQQKESQYNESDAALRLEQGCNGTLKSNLEAAQNEILLLKEVNQKLETDNDDLRKDLSAEVHHWWAIADGLNRDFEIYRTNSASEVHRWWSVADGLARDLEELKRRSALEVHKWWATADSLLRQEAAMRHSLSWRLTMPLRGIRHPVRTIKRLAKALLRPFTALKGTPVGRKLGKRFPSLAKAVVKSMVSAPPPAVVPTQPTAVSDPVVPAVFNPPSRGEFPVGRLSERSLQILTQLRRSEGKRGTHS